MAKKPTKAGEKALAGFTFTKNQTLFLNALRENLGIVSKAAHAANLHRNNHFQWIKKSPEYKEEYESILEECLDFAENALMENISNGEVTSIIFYLKTKGKKRGYVEKQEIEHSGNVQMTRKIGFSEDEN